MQTLTLTEAAAFLKLHPNTVQERARRGIIPGSKPGRRWAFKESELEYYLRKCQNLDRPEEAILHGAIRIQKYAAIYFLLRGEKIVYIGKTTNLLGRLGSHAFQKDFDGFAYIPCNVEDLDKNERAMVEKFQPELNRFLKGKR